MTIGLVLFLLSIIMMSGGLISAIYGFVAAYSGETAALAASTAVVPSGILLATGIGIALLGMVLLITIRTNGIYKGKADKTTVSKQHRDVSSSHQISPGK